MKRRPPVTEPEQSNESTLPEDELPVAESVEEASETLSEDADGAVAEPQDLAPPVELVFEFAGDCWMNLVDATGEAIAYGVKAQGRIMPVTGVPPFEVTLGAPEVVQISYNGEAVDMSRFRAGQTARFSLPFAE